MRRLSHTEIRLLLNALESRRPVLSGPAAELYRTELQGLRALSLLRPEGHDQTAASPTDELVSLQWCPETDAYRYFSEDDGWVEIPAQQVNRYVVDISRFLAVGASRLSLSAPAPLVRIPDFLWDLGTAKIVSRRKKTPIWFARRLGDIAVCHAINEHLRLHPSDGTRLVMTSTRADRIRSALPKCKIVCLKDFLRHGAWPIEPAALEPYLNELPLVSDDPIRVIAAGREVHFKGRAYSFKGDTQRRIIMYLHDRYLNGELQVSSQQVLDDLELGLAARIQDIFKKSPAWNRLLRVKNGMCGFCWDSNTP